MCVETATGADADVTLCDSRLKPEMEEKCNMDACPAQ